MTRKSDSKFKEKLTRGLKNDMRTLVNFHESSWKSTNLHFDVLLLSKAYKYLDEKVKKSYVSWHWRVMQSLRKNWLLVPKMALEIWWILRWAEASLKIFTLMCYLCQRYIKWSKLWRKTDVLLKKHMMNRNLVNFNASSGKSENLYFYGLLL